MRTLRRISPGRLALAGLFVGLLVVAAGLRFYDLPGQSTSYDEAAASRNAGGALSEVIPNTRVSNSSPILYPLALWAVQKVDVSAFSVRLLPAAASVLTIAVMLFLLPRLGVNRWAAFLAALLATLSMPAIWHAQDAREYSIDALLTVLLLAGLLWYLRDGKKVLLCVALFVAPLVQYGLALFGVAVLVAAIVLPRSPTLAASADNSALNRVSNWLKQRIALVGPAACFLAGCALSYAVTLRYQWWRWGYGPEVGQANRYKGGFDEPVALLEFSITRIWRLLTYHLPEVVAVAALVALALLLAASLKRRRLDAITTLALLAVGAALCAAVLTFYPMGGIRQNLYLGPVIFLAAGVAIHWAAKSLAGLTRRGWLAPALTVAAAGAIALAGVGDLLRDSPYEKPYNAKAVLAYLQENGAAGDVVFVTHFATLSIKFHQAEKPGNYHYGEQRCWTDFAECLRELERLVHALPDVPNRIYLVHERLSLERLEVMGEQVELLGETVPVERVIVDGEINIALIANAGEYVVPAYEALAADYAALVSGEPAIRSDFGVYLNGNTLTYVKEPCVPADTEAQFFLALYPVDVNDLPGPRQQHGFDNLDFRFGERGVVFGGKCMATVALPEYAVTRISTGQYVPVEGGFNNLWEGEIHLEP